MPGGFSGGGFFAVLVTLAGMAVGYVVLLIKAWIESVRSGPNRVIWRIVLVLLIAIGWFVALRPMVFRSS